MYVIVIYCGSIHTIIHLLRNMVLIKEWGTYKVCETDKNWFELYKKVKYYIDSDMNMLSIREIDECLKNNLTEIILSSREIRELPKEIGQLTNLQNFYVHNNKLTELPKEIGQLTNLQYFDVSNNQLIGAAVPKEIGQLIIINIEIL